MTDGAGAPAFHVVPGDAVAELLRAMPAAVFDAVAQAYRLHDAGDTVNPESVFLARPDQPMRRVIALPAYVGGPVGMSGLKWISSVPENRSGNLARAGAVLVLNDPATGYPIACLEGAAISAERTAASAALAAEALTPWSREGALGIIGTGIIARTTLEWLIRRGWRFDAIRLYDRDPAEALRFAGWIRRQWPEARPETVGGAETAMRGAALVVLATTAIEPHIGAPERWDGAPTVLHLSLRDLSVERILAAQNIVDDAVQCLKARTSLHRAAQATAGTAFIAGTLADLLEGRLSPDSARPRVFSPFGLGILDVAVGSIVWRTALERGRAVLIPGFFAPAARW